MAFGLRLIGVEPPCVHTFLKQSGVGVGPVLLTRRWIGGVIEGLAYGMKTRLDGLGDEPSIFVERVVGRAAGTEVFFVQRVDETLRVGIVLVPFHLAHGDPPEPILHNVVDGNVLGPVTRGYCFQLLLRLVLVFALPEAVCPAAKERHLAGELAIAGDDLVGVRAVDEVVVDAVGDFCAQIERMNETIVHAAARGVVPEDAVSVGGDEERNGDVGVLLRQVNRFAAIIPHAGLVLAETIETFMRAVDGKRDLCMKCFFAIHFDGAQRAIAVGGKHGSAHSAAGRPGSRGAGAG